MAHLMTPEQIEELKKCANGLEGLFYWAKKYATTWDRANKRKRLYPLWDFQKEFLAELEEGGLILVEKSRDVMVTWTVCLHMFWHIQFDPFWTGFATSRREAEVDNGGERSTTGSIFGRLRFLWKEQPDWLKMDLRFSHLKIVNQEEDMYTEITGESANPDVGRSSDVYFKWGDEFALVEHSEKAHAAMVGGGFNTLVYTSTSNLGGNEFHRLRSRQGSGFRVLRYSWKLRPDRDEEWYKNKVATMTEEQRAKELDIQYEVVGPRKVWSQFDSRIHTCQAKDLPHGAGRAAISLDEGFAQPGAMYYARYWQGTMYVFEEVYKAGIQLVLPPDTRTASNKDWIAYIEDLVDRHGPIEVVCLGFESRGFEAVLISKGYKVYRVGKDRLGRIRQVTSLMPVNPKGKPGLVISDECVNLLREIPDYQWKSVSGVIQDRPQGGNDHGCDSLQQLAEYFLLPEEVQENRWVSTLEAIGK